MEEYKFSNEPTQAPAQMPVSNPYRDELNFAEFPLAALSDTVPQGQKTLTFEDQIFDEGNRKLVTRQLKISASDEYGLPTAKDDEVVLGLLQLSSLGGFRDRKLYFTRYELIKLLGWEDSTSSYARIEQSLKRWIGTTLYYKNAWWDKVEKSWVDEAFHIIDHVTIYDAERRLKRVASSGEDSHVGKSFVLWSERVFNSFEAGYLKRLDLELYKTLKSQISKRLYRFLDKRLYQKRELEFPLRLFALEKIGLSRKYHNGEIKRRLTPAILELEELGFLKPLPPERRFVQTGRGEWKVVFVKGGVSAEVALEKADLDPLVCDLVKRGISEGVAKRLVATKTKEEIQNQMEVFDYLLEHKDPKVSKNPAGFLVSAIGKGFGAPRGYVGKAEREASLREHEVKAKQVLAAQDRRVKLQQETEETERATLSSFWEALSSGDKQAFEVEAVSHADSFLKKTYFGEMARGGNLFLATRQNIINAHIRRKLGEQAAKAA